MRINPCHGCPFKKGCDLFDEFRTRAHGIGAKSVTFRCQRIVKKIPKGTRITMSMPYVVAIDCGYDARIKKSAMKATVLSVSDDGTFNAVMDNNEMIDEDKFRWRKAKHVRTIISFLDEPLVPICKNGNPIQGESCDRRDVDGGCWCANEKANAREWHWP